MFICLSNFIILGCSAVWGDINIPSSHLDIKEEQVSNLYRLLELGDDTHDLPSKLNHETKQKVEQMYAISAAIYYQNPFVFTYQVVKSQDIGCQ